MGSVMNSDYRRGDVAVYMSDMRNDRWVGVVIGHNTMGVPIFNWFNVYNKVWAKAAVPTTNPEIVKIGTIPGEAEWDV